MFGSAKNREYVAKYRVLVKQAENTLERARIMLAYHEAMEANPDFIKVIRLTADMTKRVAELDREAQQLEAEREAAESTLH